MNNNNSISIETVSRLLHLINCKLYFFFYGNDNGIIYEKYWLKKDELIINFFIDSYPSWMRRYSKTSGNVSVNESNALY